MKWFFLFLIICIIVPGLHYTGFIVLFDDPLSKNVSGSAPHSQAGLKKSNWSPISAPKWQAQSLNGDVFFLEELKGKIVILNFWASWCLPCHKEFPELVAAAKWAKGEMILVAVSVDSSKKDVENFLKKFTKYQNKDFFKKNRKNLSGNKSQSEEKKRIHIIWDPNYEVAKQFNVVKLPETFILNKELKIVKKYIGELSFKEIKYFLEPLLTRREQN